MKAQALERKLSIKTHHESYEKDFVIILNSYVKRKKQLATVLFFSALLSDEIFCVRNKKKTRGSCLRYPFKILNKCFEASLMFTF